MDRRWHIGIATHKGTRKPKNEDSLLHLIEVDASGNEMALFAVADGMGGYEVGEIASDLAISQLQKWWEKRIPKLIKKKDVMDRILKESRNLVRQMNKSILDHSKQTGQMMGTTLSMLFIYKGIFAVVHIGDSRIYHLKNWSYGLQQYFHQKPESNFQPLQLMKEQNTEELDTEPIFTKLTEDHSWVANQVEQGILNEEEAREHPKRNVLTKCLGIQQELEPFALKGSYQPSDLFLVCSDGFYSLFSNEEIKNMLISLEKEYTNLQAISDYLVNFSNFSEANDNVTLMLVRNTYVNKDRTSTKKQVFPFLNRNRG